MTKKGFTLIELLSVIVVLAVILAIVIPIVINVINKAKLDAKIKDREIVVKAAENYSSTYFKELPKKIGDTVEVTIDFLKNEGFLKNVKSEEFNGYVIITKTTSKNYDYTPYIYYTNNIGNSTEDGLVANWKFDDFQEATINIYANYANLKIQHNFDIIDNNITYGDNTTYNNRLFYVARLFKSEVLSTGSASYRKCIPSGGVGNKFTVTYKVKILSGDISSIGIHSNGGTTAFSPKYIDSSGWNYFEYNSMTSHATSLCVGIGFVGNNAVDSLITEPQVEFKAYSTPFVNGTRNGIVKDYSGNKNNSQQLQLISTPQWTNDSKVGSGAYKFDGVGNYIDFGNTNFDYPEFTVSLWAKSITNLSTNPGFPIHVTNLIGNGNWNNANNWYIGYKSSSSDPATHLSFAYGISWSAGPSYSVNNYDLSQWNNFVGVATPTTQKLYINGKLVSTVNTTHASVASSYNLQIGRSSYSSRFFNGSIDDVQIYSRALSAEEINLNYELTK